MTRTLPQPALAHRRATTEQPIDDLLAVRWSPRSFDPESTVSEQQVTSLLEAARWAASASNVQPRRFITARRGTGAFETVVDRLMGFNRAWAVDASLLVVAIAVTEPQDPADPAAKASAYRWAEYDLGQSMANLATQAHALGLHVHQMGGIEVEGLRTAFDLPERYLPVTVAAVGTAAHADRLPEPHRARETADRVRLPLDELVLVRE